MPLLSAGECDIGRKRKNNQDNIALCPDQWLYLVADGMGGHKGGDTASRIAAEKIPEFYAEFAHLSPRDRLIQSILGANQEILSYAVDHPQFSGMGTTATVMAFHDQYIHLGNVGDSRCYLIHQAKLYQLTRDHSLVQEKLNLGIYNRKQAAKDSQKNILTRTVGFEPHVEVDTYSYKVHHYDLFLACSDGLHGALNDQDILTLVNCAIPSPANATQYDLDRCVKSLVHYANHNGGHDNISVILVLAK